MPCQLSVKVTDEYSDLSQCDNPISIVLSIDPCCSYIKKAILSICRQSNPVKQIKPSLPRRMEKKQLVYKTVRHMNSMFNFLFVYRSVHFGGTPACLVAFSFSSRNENEQQF